MDEETLAPMADALSATLAVIVLLICFFVLGQVVAVSKQIKVEEIGAKELVQYDLNLDFEQPEVKNGTLFFNRSFDYKANLPLVLSYLQEAKEACLECTSFIVTSNYPQVSMSLKRSKRAALANAMKVVPSLVKMKMDYEINLTNNGNSFYVNVKGVH